MNTGTIEQRVRAASSRPDYQETLSQLSETMDLIAVCGRDRDFSGLRRAMAMVDAAFARLEQINQEARANG